MLFWINYAKIRNNWNDNNSNTKHKVKNFKNNLNEFTQKNKFTTFA
jgi:hypothetical protein